MKNICLYLLFTLVFFSSCGKPSLEDDARKAAEFTNESNRRASDSDFQGASRYYNEAQEIIDRYRGEENFHEFISQYDGFLEIGIYNNLNVGDASSTSEDNSIQNKNTY